MTRDHARVTPIGSLADQLEGWSCDPEVFWQHCVEQLMELESMRQSAKDITVWLELRGLDDDGGEVDDAVASVREAAREFNEACSNSAEYPPESISCQNLRDRLIETAQEAVQRLLAVDGDLSDNVFQGFGDE